MSTYQDFLDERDKIDFLIQKGYFISNVTENLSGAYVEFQKVNSTHSKQEKEHEVLLILHPDARKYFSVILIKQQTYR